MNVAIIAIAKNEQLYIKEWLDYHLKLGFDKIIVADNDDTLLLSPFASERVIIEDYRHFNPVQARAYSELYKKYQKVYDWILFMDIDEYMVLEKDKDIKTFLQRFNRSEIDTIRLTGRHYTDNNDLDVIDGDYSTFNRFTVPIKTDKDRFCKSFINTKIDLGIRKILGHGIYDRTLNAVNAKGEKCGTDRMLDKAVYEVAWYNHYRTRTIGEYIRQKYARGGANHNPLRYRNWKVYFSVTNELTPEKIEYAEKLIKEMSAK